MKCPLTSKECDPDCAWYLEDGGWAGCAVKSIALDLSGIRTDEGGSA